MRHGGHRPEGPASLADIDLDRVRRVMFRADGNVTKAAKILKVSSSDLRRLTWRHPTLIMDALEHAHRMVDQAESKLREALDSDNLERSLRAATFVLSHSRAARERGWGRSAGSCDADSPQQTTIVVRWDGDSPGYRPPLRAAPGARPPDVDAPEDGRVQWRCRLARHAVLMAADELAKNARDPHLNVNATRGLACVLMGG